MCIRDRWGEEAPGKAWTEVEIVAHTELPPFSTGDAEAEWVAQSIEINGVLFGPKPVLTANV
jgi:hypothetical protein